MAQRVVRLMMRMLAASAVLTAAACGSPASGPASEPGPSTTEPAEPVATPSSAGVSTTAIPTTGEETPAGSSTPSAPAAAVAHVFPATARGASYGATHHDYPATDIFAACGSAAVAPVGGVIVHWRTTDAWSPDTDNPALRGGRSAAIVGDDGVRYYLSHFASMQPGLGVGSRVEAGQPLASVGHSGNARNVGCHIHFGLSPDCPAPEWSVRRGVVPPAPYLDAWRAGRNASPSAEVESWAAAHPDACATAAADRFAPDAG